MIVLSLLGALVVAAAACAVPLGMAVAVTLEDCGMPPSLLGTALVYCACIALAWLIFTR